MTGMSQTADLGLLLPRVQQHWAGSVKPLHLDTRDILRPLREKIRDGHIHNSSQHFSSTSTRTSWIERLQADTSWTTCRSLEMKLSVWRLCWISGGYRLEAASRPIALYIVGIRGAQGRSQHFESGPGTLVESESWLAMADCLGRFGRASHSNPRYHSPTQNFGQVQMHVQRNSCDQIRLCFICTPATCLQDELPFAVFMSSVRAPCCLRSSNITRCAFTRPREFACLIHGDAPNGALYQIRYACDPWCW